MEAMAWLAITMLTEYMSHKSKSKKSKLLNEVTSLSLHTVFLCFGHLLHTTNNSANIKNYNDI